MKNNAILVFSRYDSSRLPGKALADIGGREMLARVLDRMQMARRCRRVIVATTDREVDAPVVALCQREGVETFRGDCADVAGRALACCEAHGLARFVRISGDSPYLPFELIDRAFDAADETGAELVTNVFPRSFPPGASVEVVQRDALARAHPAMTPSDREDVTAAFYKTPGRWRIVNFAAGDDRYAGIRLTVDTPEELERARGIARRLGPVAVTASLDRIVAAWRAQTAPSAV